VTVLRASKADAVACCVGAASAVFPVPARSWDLLVNATPLGMSPKANDSPFDGPFDGRLVYDLVYNPAETVLLRHASAAGCETIGGLDMLVAQAEDRPRQTPPPAS
jgi:shikimate 5-dehydrogenase